MTYKNFKDYRELIDVLKARNLVVKNEVEAIAFLQKVYYYRLSAYFIPFQYPKDSENKDIFKDNVTFEDITNLYMFDRDLRNIIFHHLQDLELVLRAQISHIHSKQYEAFGYIENTNSLKRELRTKNNFLFYEFIAQINKEKARANESFIRHIKEKYKIDDLPIWALVEITSFGNLSKFFKLMQKNEQLQLLHFFNLADIRLHVFENWLECLSYTRNICAHHSRLWNRNFVLKFKTDTNHIHNSFKNDKVSYALSVIALLTEKEMIKQDLIKLFESYPHIDKRAMGFSNNWRSLAPWSNI